MDKVGHHSALLIPFHKVIADFLCELKIVNAFKSKKSESEGNTYISYT